MRAIYKIHIVEQVSKHPRQKKHIGAKICLIHVTKVFETAHIRISASVTLTNQEKYIMEKM